MTVKMRFILKLFSLMLNPHPRAPTSMQLIFQKLLSHHSSWMPADKGKGAVQGTAFCPSPVDNPERHVIHALSVAPHSHWMNSTGKPDCASSSTKITGFSPRASL